MSIRISKNNQSEELTADASPMTAGRSLNPPEFNLTAGSGEQMSSMETADAPIQGHFEQEGGDMASYPDEAYSEPFETSQSEDLATYPEEAYTEPATTNQSEDLATYSGEAYSEPVATNHEEELATYPEEVSSQPATATQSEENATFPPEAYSETATTTPGEENATFPPETDTAMTGAVESEELATFPKKEMDPAAKLLKFLDHLEVIMDIKDALTPSLWGIYKTQKKIRGLIEAMADAKKGTSLARGMSLGSILKNAGSLGLAYQAIDTTYWATVKGSKLLGRGVYAAQELTGQISAEKYQRLVEDMEDNVPESLIGLSMMPSGIFRKLRKIKRMTSEITKSFSTLNNLRKSVKAGTTSMLDVVNTVSDIKDFLQDLRDLCQEVQSLTKDLGMEFDLKPIDKAIDKFSAPLKSMKELMGDALPKPKAENNTAPEGGAKGLLNSLEPAYKPLVDSMPW